MTSWHKIQRTMLNDYFYGAFFNSDLSQSFIRYIVEGLQESTMFESFLKYKALDNSSVCLYHRLLDDEREFLKSNDYEFEYLTSPWSSSFQVAVLFVENEESLNLLRLCLDNNRIENIIELTNILKAFRFSKC